MRIIELTADCPECGEQMINTLGDLTGTENIQVDIFSFAQSEFYCEECDKRFFTGDIHLFAEDEI